MEYGGRQEGSHERKETQGGLRGKNGHSQRSKGGTGIDIDFSKKLRPKKKGKNTRFGREADTRYVARDEQKKKGLKEECKKGTTRADARMGLRKLKKTKKRV